MSQVRIGAIFAVFVGVVCVASLRAGRLRPTPPKTPSGNARTVDNPTVGYRHWTRVNATPHEITSALSMLCISPTPEMVAKEASNPHLDQLKNASFNRRKYVVVYANDIAKDAMLHQKNPLFPIGSLLVKEKLDRAHSIEPEMLTAMRKHEAGFDPKNGDWEYFVLNGSGTSVLAQGKLKTCQSCHSEYKGTDFVARTYLSEDLRKSLR